MRTLIFSAALMFLGCSATTDRPVVTIEVPTGAGAQCFELPGTIRVSYYKNDEGDPLVFKLGKALLDFGLLDSLWGNKND